MQGSLLTYRYGPRLLYLTRRPNVPTKDFCPHGRTSIPPATLECAALTRYLKSMRLVAVLFRWHVATLEVLYFYRGPDRAGYATNPHLTIKP